MLLEYRFWGCFNGIPQKPGSIGSRFGALGCQAHFDAGHCTAAAAQQQLFTVLEPMFLSA